MNIKKLTTKPTEADLEAKIRGVLEHVYPWLPATSLQHQIKFSFKFGRAVVEVDGKETWRVEARADILVSTGGKPLSIIELKREDLTLTQADTQQALSYARMLAAPLAILTNGKETQIFTAHDGSLLDNTKFTEKQLEETLSAVGKVAAADIKNAVSVLLGPGSGLWMQAIRATTKMEVDELVGSWDEPLQPFVSEFLIPRQATENALKLLREKHKTRAIIVEGAPLSGKSSILRDIVERTSESEDLVVLFLDASSCSEGILQRLANIFASRLNWPATVDDIRSWLRGMSSLEDSPRLIIAVDGPSVRLDQVRRDVDELVSKDFGGNLKILLTLDESTVERWTYNETKTSQTKLGRFSETVSVGRLTDDEFDIACNILQNSGAEFMLGADLSYELRVPWVLRSIASEALSLPGPPEKGLTAVLPSMLGVTLVERARERFSNLADVGSILRRLARCLMEDMPTVSRPISLVLESMELFLIRDEACKGRLEYAEIKELIDKGFVKKTNHSSGTPIVVPRFPELFASEIALELGERLAARIRKHPVDAAKWLVGIVSRLPMGDVLGAQAVFDAAEYLEGGLALDFFNEMLQMRPEAQPITPGFKGAFYWPEVGVVEVSYGEDGSVYATAPRQSPKRLEMDANDLEEMKMHSSPVPWLILSHLAGADMRIVDGSGKEIGRASPAILMEVASCPIVLRRPNVDSFEKGIWTHSIPNEGEIVCHKSGIVEPITLSLIRMLATMDVDDALIWIDDALERKSFPLLARIQIALLHISNLHNRTKAAWAKGLLETKIASALSAFPALH